MSQSLNVQMEMSSQLKEIAESKQNEIEKMMGTEQYPFKTLDKSYFRQPAETCLEVNLNVVVTSLCDIDTLNQSYTMRVELWVAWPLLEQEAISYCTNPNEFKPVLHPRPLPRTAPFDTCDFMIFPSDRTIQVFIFAGKVMACECTLISGRFFELMELENFPFDCQHLSFHIGIRNDCDMPMKINNLGEFQMKDIKSINGFMNFDGRAMMSLKLKQDSCCFNVRTSYLSICDFDLHIIEAEIENMPDDIPFLHCSLRLSRNWNTYIYRVFLTMFFIMCISCTVFRFPQELQDRLSFIATMFLTSVAFLFIVGGWLPQLKYLTLIDKYMMFSFSFITSIVFQVTIYDVLELTLDQQWPILLINLSICILFHIVLIYHCFHLRKNETAKLKKNRREIDNDYIDKESGQNKDQHIVHTGISHHVTVDKFKVYEGSLRTDSHGWMVERSK